MSFAQALLSLSCRVVRFINGRRTRDASMRKSGNTGKRQRGLRFATSENIALFSKTHGSLGRLLLFDSSLLGRRAQCK